VTPAEPQTSADAAPPWTRRRHAASWLLLEAAHDPLRSLLLGVVFPGYLTARIFADPTEGQAAWGIAVAVAAGLAAITAPLIGRLADARHLAGLLLAGSAGLAGLLSASLWFAVPGVAPFAVLAVVALIAVVIEL
jgi:UMF1 family MFS transporter